MVLSLLLLCAFQTASVAQNAKVEINGNDVGSWFSRNWIFVTIIIVALFIFLLISEKSKSSRSRTTIFRNNKGEVTKTEITKTDEG